MGTPSLFDRNLRRLRRDRAVRSARDPFLHAFAYDVLLDRLGDVKRPFERALLLGCPDPSWRRKLEARVESVVVADISPGAARRCDGLVVDEDRLAFADATFDLVIAVGTLDTVDDLPGALVLLRRVLRPDGLLLAAFAGAASLPRLRSAMLAADAVSGGATPRMHPGIDLRAAGDLLARTGFALPVADTEALDVSYAGLESLVADLRAHGATNMLARRSTKPLSRAALAVASADFAAAQVDGRTTERMEILYLSGWNPVPCEPRQTGPVKGAGRILLE
jgi:SAM-dependent methyltransferase